jgi:phosphoserine phosphatase
MIQPILLNQQAAALRVLLVRHGETDWNVENRFQGQKDVPLNHNGIKQAQRVRDFLADVPIDCAFSSSLSRAKQTAEIIIDAQGLSLNIDDRFKEVNHGDWEGLIKADVEQLYPKQFALWKNQPSLCLKPNGETLEEVRERVITAWERLIEGCMTTNTKTVLVVAHQVINQVILCHISGLEPDSLDYFPQNNCCINILDYPKPDSKQACLQVLNLNAAWIDALVTA